MGSTTSDILARAKQTPLSRPAVEELAKSSEASAAAVKAALAAGEIHAATVLAFASIAAGRLLDVETMATLIADVEAPALVGPLASGCSDGIVPALVRLLEDGRSTYDREALALLVLSHLGKDKDTKIPSAALRHARKLCRRAILPETSIVLGGAAQRFGDPELKTLAAEDIKKASRQKRVVEDLIVEALRSPLDALGATSAPRIVQGYTVRKDPSVGRNDACPCGSGKKFKKCCALKEESALVVSTPRMEVSTLHPEQILDMRPGEVVRLETAKLTRKAWLQAYRRVLSLREWAIAERMIDEAPSMGESEARVVDLRVMLLHAAAEAGDREIAERAFESLPKEEQPYEKLMLSLVRRDADVLEQVEAAAEAALADESNGAASIELAYALLHMRPALGIFVARGAMHEGRVHDCQTLLDEMEDARDRLLLPAIEPWWDFYDNMIDAADDRDERIAKTAEQAELARELKKARDEKRRATAELTKMREKLDELDAQAAEAGPAPAPSSKKDKAAAALAPSSAPAMLDAAALELEEERRRLRTKVAELKRIVDEGQEERRELRKRLMQATAEQEEEEERGAPSKAPRSADDDDARERALESEEAPEEPRGVLVPRFSDRAAKALRDLDGAIAEIVLALTAGLAAGKANAWGGTKQLKKVRGVISARAGIHHRVLFEVRDGVLDVLEVIARKDLEVTVTRLAALR